VNGEVGDGVADLVSKCRRTIFDLEFETPLIMKAVGCWTLLELEAPSVALVVEELAQVLVLLVANCEGRKMKAK